MQGMRSDSRTCPYATCGEPCHTWRLSYAIVSVGGFLGIGKRLVAIPVEQLRDEKGKLILPGATKEALKALPEFQYAA